MRAAVASSLLLVTMAVSSAAIEASQTKQYSVTPAETVKRFYTIHFSSNKRFTLREIKRKREWLAPELYDLLVAEVNRKYPPDTVPDINGDPFTYSQEYPASFVLGKTRTSDSKSSVEIVFRWTAKGKTVETRTYVVELIKLSESWKISNIIYGKDQDMLGLLKHAS